MCGIHTFELNYYTYILLKNKRKHNPPKKKPPMTQGGAVGGLKSNYHAICCW